MNKLFVTIPHAGEQIPDICTWLKTLPETVLMCDTDRYVDRLYSSIVQDLNLEAVVAPWHRYAVDLNRQPQDLDEGAPGKKLSGGFHWRFTTLGQTLLDRPITPTEHAELVALIYEPFHSAVGKQFEKRLQAGFLEVYHLDLHSMPSTGNASHRDPGEKRADIVISDSLGKSANREFVDQVLLSFVRAGLKVSYNWPYVGGRLTEQYGQPQKHQHTVQVELNRSLYMDESTKAFLPEKAEKLIPKLREALTTLTLNLK